MLVSGIYCQLGDGLCYRSHLLGEPETTTIEMVGWASGMVGWASGMVGWASGMVGWASGMVGWASGMVGWASGMVGKHLSYLEDLGGSSQFGRG